MFGLFRNIGSGEVVIIALLILFFFGGSKLSEFAKGLRQSKKELGKIKKDLENTEETEGGKEE